MPASPRSSVPAPNVPERAAKADPAFDAASVAAALRASFPHLDAGVAESTPKALYPGLDIAVLLPCYNEAGTIADVIESFRQALPGARIYVFDNCSTDATAAVAASAGAEVMREPRRGKGNVVRRMFAEIDADIYLMADGDGTYDAGSAPRLVSLMIDESLDMAVGARENILGDAHRPGHAFGNTAFNRLYAALFGAGFGDIFSGYRAFSRRFVKSFPALSSGFEIETELSVHASSLKLPVGEIVLAYGKRPQGSASKLHTFRDGWRILSTFFFLLKETRPALFFGALAGFFALLAVILAIPLFDTWLETGLVPRLPTAILCTGLMLASCLMMTCGLILDSLARSRVEQKRIFYLAVSKTRL